MREDRPLQILQNTRQELGASVLLVASDNGEALLCDGHDEPKNMKFLAALGAAGLSALQEVVTTSFQKTLKSGEEQLLTLEVAHGVILILSTPPFLFLAVLEDKTRLGLARLLLRRLARDIEKENLFHFSASDLAAADLPQATDDEEANLFESLWR